MSIYNHLGKLAVAAAVTGLLVYPSGAYATNDDVVIFPPQLPSPAPVGTLCPPNPPGYTYTLIWDGVHNVECGQVPTTCQAGQGLQFNGSNFVCVTPCSGPTTTFQTTGACPNGETGEIGNSVVTQCDGSSTSTATNTCGQLVVFPAVSAVECTVGATVVGYFDSTGSFNTQCTATTPCQNYTCTTGGPVIQ
jgi:hypothetical protein